MSSRFLAAALLALLAACAPRLQQPGPSDIAPALLPDAAVMADGVVLPMRHWLPPGPPDAIVLALHGFNDYSKAFDEVGPALAREGIAVYANDQRGFGQTPQRGIWAGTDRLAGDLEAVARLLREKHPGRRLVLLGESMGGAVGMVALARDAPPPIDAAALIAPAVWGRESIGPVASGSLWLLAHSVPALELSARGLRIRASDNIDALIELAHDPLVIKGARTDTVYGLVELMDRAAAAAPRLALPLLVLYGAKDEVIPRRPTCRMLERLPVTPGGRRWRIATYPDGYHLLTRDLEGDRVIADIAAWVLDPAAPLPSGSEDLPPGAGSRLCPERDPRRRRQAGSAPRTVVRRITRRSPATS